MCLSPFGYVQLLFSAVQACAAIMQTGGVSHAAAQVSPVHAGQLDQGHPIRIARGDRPDRKANSLGSRTPAQQRAGPAAPLLCGMYAGMGFV
jgi:hypothetical protein